MGVQLKALFDSAVLVRLPLAADCSAIAVSPLASRQLPSSRYAKDGAAPLSARSTRT